MRLKPRMMLKLVVLLVLVALVQPGVAFQIRRVGTDSGVILRLRGDVRLGDYRGLNTILQNRPVVGLEIRSGGGSFEDGLDIARVVREKGLVVYAAKECDSACAFIFFAAKERYIGPACKIGAHSISNDPGKENGDTAPTTIPSARLFARPPTHH